jgi:uncharacterized membrane protein
VKPRGAYFAAVSSISIALVAVATLAIQVYIPATRGYFNIGEVMVYTIALLFGPRIGCIAGGLGSALADIISGYSFYAPVTLIAKGLEGYLVGRISRLRLNITRRFYRILSVILPITLTLVFWAISSQLYTGLAEVTLTYYAIEVEIPPALWIIVSIALLVILAVYLSKVDSENIARIIAIICGGSIMVSCYYLYEQVILGVYALAEVPVNIGQMLIGLSVSIPLSKALAKINLPTIIEDYGRHPSRLDS